MRIEMIKRIAAMEAQISAQEAQIKQLRDAGKILLDDSIPLNTGLKAVRAALAATETKETK